MNIRSNNVLLKAYDVLAVQPVTSNGLSLAERDAIVISAIVNEYGEIFVLSRFGDAEWDMRPYFEQPNVAEAYKYIKWDAGQGGIPLLK